MASGEKARQRGRFCGFDGQLSCKFRQVVGGKSHARPPGCTAVYLERNPMRGRQLFVSLVVLALGLVPTPVLADKRSEAKEHVDFGIAVAQRGVWREAAFRWRQAVELDPTYAEAWNNLGIGYEQLGRFDDARKAYEKALEIDPANTFIRNNYDLFREIYDRQNRRRDR